jgi:Cu(I)/Ag(I) efflux system membrane protein CusA/SilA
MGREFMPPLDEGSYLLMPTTGAHASIGEAMDVLRKQDLAIRRIPEVKDVVGKIGRVDSALDPAPINMIETVITYHDEYKKDEDGHVLLFRTDDSGHFVQDERGELIEDPEGRPLRQWRDEIQAPDDIWEEIKLAATIPGTTGASRLQPIEARRVMLQTGLRAPMGLKVFAPDLETLDHMMTMLEQALKKVPAIDSSTVVADRVVGKPYLEIRPHDDIARYGLHIRDVQDVIEVAIGGRTITTSVEGRERYPIRVRYMRERRDSIEEIGSILVAARDGTQVPLREVADIEFVRGPQAIKSEDTQLVGYVTFDKRPDMAQVETVEAAQAHLDEMRRNKELIVPAGVDWKWAGDYQNQQRAQRRLAWVVPLALAIIFLILYLQFRRISTTFWVFSGVFVAAAGGFIMLWLYAQPGFLDVDVLGTNLRELFNIRAFNLSVAVWVGFLALWGIATDDGVIMATYIRQRMDADRPQTVQDIREAVVAAGKRRIRPCLMTSATTILALIPILMSTGRGADIMVPMAIPSFGGMVIVLITVFVVPTLYSLWEELLLWWRNSWSHESASAEAQVAVSE